MANRSSKPDWSGAARPQLPPLESLRQWLARQRRRSPELPRFDQPSDVDRTKSMADLPLSREGSHEVAEVGQELGSLGTLDTVMFSRLKRTEETAQEIAAGAHGVLLDITPHSFPWCLGEMEGQPVKDSLEQLRWFVLHPDQPIPGVSELSGYPGESYSSFKHRWLGWLRDGPMRGSLAQVNRVAIVTHSHNQKCLKDWIDAGAKPDLTTADVEITAQSEPPGSVDRLWHPPSGAWQLDHPFSFDAHPSLPPGIYVIRHGATPWNKQSQPK